MDRRLGRIQQEIDHTINRVARLSGEDNFGHPASMRPVPSAKDEMDPTKQKRLYEEKEDLVKKVSQLILYSLLLVSSDKTILRST